MTDRADDTPAAPAPQQPAGIRQAPQFGEYAPEGWSWAPEGAEADGTVTDASSAPGAPGDVGTVASAGMRPPTADAGAPAPSTGRVPGVPHNLGASGPDIQDQAPLPAPAPTTPPTDPAQQGQHYRAETPPPQAGPRQLSGGRRADRVITIILLVLGAFGALYLASSMQQLPASLSVLATALGIEGFTVPASVSTLGTVGALIVFALYALNLIYSIQRMRHGKITFWVPLTAGAIAFIIVFAFTAFAMYQAPELVRAFTDPEASAKLFDYLSQVGTDTP